MKQTEESLLKRNRLAATIGQEIVLEQLKLFREQFVGQLKAVIPTANDPYGINLHRALGRVEALDYIISQAEQSIKQSNTKD